MGRSKAYSWIAGAVVAALLIALAGWAFLISPRLESADELRAETESQVARADQLRIQLAGLKRDFEKLDDFKAQLAALQQQLPDTVDLANVTRQITDLALQSGVFLEAVKPGMPVEATPVAAPAAAAPTEGTDPASSDSGTAGSGSEGSNSAGTGDGGGSSANPTRGVSGLYAVQVEITVLGGYAPTMDFLSRLQSGATRLYLVSGITVTGQEPAAASGGKPAIAEGDAETVIKAYLYVLQDPNAAAPADPAAGGTTGTNS